MFCESMGLEVMRGSKDCGYDPLNSQCKMTENRPQTPPQGKIFFEYISPDSSRIITQLLQI